MSACDVMGFLTYHSQKVLDEPLVSQVDKDVFKWRQEAFKAAEDAKNLPVVTCTVDGYGSSYVHTKSQETLAEIVKAESAEGDDREKVRYKSFRVKNRRKEVRGKVRLVHEVNQENTRNVMVEKALNMPLYLNVAKKRGVKYDLVENAKLKCKRRTTPSELFGATLD